jgi:hypothetical protein
VIVNRDREDTFRRRLTNHILVQVLDDLPGSWNIVEQRGARTAPTLLLVKNRLAQLDALSTDVDVTWTFDERSNVAITLPTKRTESVLFVRRGSAARV